MNLIIKGDKKALEKLLANPTKDVQTAVRRGLSFFGRKIRQEVQQDILHGTKSGKLYIYRTKSGRRKNHISSASGESPANLTGNLRKATGFQVKKMDLEVGYREKNPQGKSVPYASRLERAQVEGGLNRRGIWNAIKKHNGKLPSYLITQINGVFKKK